VLGPLEVDGAAEVLGPRDRVVVSALALRPGERVDAEVLAEALWGEAPPASAAKVVQGCVSRLRKSLGADAIETVAGGYRVRSDQVDIDRQHFEDLVGRAREHLATRNPERAIPLLVEALALWRGPAFGELEEWMPGRLEAVRLGQLRLAAEEDLLQARLDCGDHPGVAADATVLTGQQPFRERRWALLALAQYRCGRQADALASIRAARRALGQELGLDPGSELVALESRILAQDDTLASDHAARMADQACPWKGLAPYGDRDGETFFGRDADIAACLARLEESALLVVTGPSGSGKSSLVQAGLVPALRRTWIAVEVFTPGTDGALAMAAARSRHATDPLLVIDQLEEAFTLGSAAPTGPWLHEVARYAHESAPVVMVVRGDHLARLGADEELARLVERGLHLVTPLAGDRLREAVEGPARVAGLRLEPGLVDLVLRDSDDQPGALPLLSHALAETWRRREAGLLTVDGYRASGGIRDAVAATAERLYEGLSSDEGGHLRWLMLHLVSLSDTGEPFRTPLPASVVAALDPVRRRLLDVLVRARLVTSRVDGYDLAHEALVRAWPRLRAWLDEDRVGQQIRRHLAMSAAGWDALDRPDGELYRGARLAAALDWLQRGDEPLAERERAFIDASRTVADRRVARLADEARRQRRQNRRLRVLVAAALVLLLVAAAAGLVAREQRLAAERGQASASAAAAVARHESLVGRSLFLRESDRAVAAMLAVLAWRQKPDVLAQSALLEVLSAERGFLGYRYVPRHALGASAGNRAAAAAVPHRARVLMAVGSSVALVDPSTGKASVAFKRPVAFNELPSVLRVSSDGTRAVQMFTDSVTRCPSACRVLVVYDLATRNHVAGPIIVPFRATDVAISGNGRLVTAVGGQGERWDVATWDASSGRTLARARLGAASVAFGAGNSLYVGTHVGRVHEVSAATLEPRRVLTAPLGIVNGRMLVSGGVLVAAGQSGLAAFDLRNGRRLWPVGSFREEAGEGCSTLAVFGPLGRVYCGAADGVVEEYDLRTGDLTGRDRFDPQFQFGGDLVVTRRRDGAPILLELSTEKPVYASWQLDGPGLRGDGRFAPGEATVALACTLAGRNPTYLEWETYVGDSEPYVEVCPGFPTAQQQFPKDEE
jgi:DNA-binding SARP family transcriptional activator